MFSSLTRTVQRSFSRLPFYQTNHTKTNILTSLVSQCLRFTPLRISRNTSRPNPNWLYTVKKMETTTKLLSVGRSGPTVYIHCEVVPHPPGEKIVVSELSWDGFILALSNEIAQGHGINKASIYDRVLPKKEIIERMLMETIYAIGRDTNSPIKKDPTGHEIKSQLSGLLDGLNTYRNNRQADCESKFFNKTRLNNLVSASNSLLHILRSLKGPGLLAYTFTANNLIAIMQEQMILNYISKEELANRISEMSKEIEDQFSGLLANISQSFEGPIADASGGHVYLHLGKKSSIFNTYEDCKLSMQLHLSDLKKKYDIYAATAMKAVENWSSFKKS